jgi:flagellum-specific ATP synthase
VTTPEQRSAAATLRRYLAAHRDVKELVEIGAYAAGGDPDADAAIALMPRINDFLRQDVDAPSALDTTWLELQGLVA